MLDLSHFPKDYRYPSFFILRTNEETPYPGDQILIFALSCPFYLQVHKRITYLRHLIVSLAQAKDISRTLLVFSHDHFDDDINDLVQSIDFCKVMQV